MNMNSILRMGIVGLLGVIICVIPFVVTNGMFFPFITGKNFLFRVLVELAFGLWIVLAYRDEAYRPQKSAILWAVIAFMGVITVADLFGENSMKAVWSNYERTEGLVTILHLGAYFLVATSVFQTMKSWMRFFQASLVASVLMAGYGLLQLWGFLDIHQGSTRLDATFGNSAYLAVYMLVNIFLAAFLAAREQGMFAKQMQIVYGAVALLDAFIVYHTATRGAILGLIAGAAVTGTLVVLFSDRESQIRRWGLGILVAVLSIVGVFFAIRDTSFVKESPVLSRFASISLTEQTTKSRFMVWDMALQGFKERPLLGWGQEGFNYVFNKYYNPKMWSQEPWFDRAHNVFLDWLIAGGALGLLAYLSLFGTLLYLVWASRVHGLSILEKSILTGLLAGYFVHNLVVFDNLMSYVLFFSILAMVHSVSVKPTPRPAENRNMKGPDRTTDVGMDTVVALAAAVLTIFVVYAVNYKPYETNVALIDTLQAQANIPTPSYELEQVFRDLNNPALSSEGRRKLFSDTTALWADSVKKYPYSERTVSLAELLALTGNGASAQTYFPAAEKTLMDAVQSSPRDIQVHVELASLYEIFGLTDKEAQERDKIFTIALEGFKRVVSYGASFGVSEAREQLSQMATRVASLTDVKSETKQSFAGFAESELEKQVQETPHDARYLSFAGDLAESFGHYDKAIDYLKRAHEFSPKKQAILFELGSAYLNVAQYPQAIDAFKTAFELDPTYPDARINYATALIYAGKSADATQLLLPMVPAGARAVGDERIYKAYLAVKQYDLALLTVQQLVAQNPKSTDYHTMLAMLYGHLGRIQDAINELAVVVKLDPTKKDAVAGYVKSLQSGQLP
ncbi:MAG: O-antigen ligase family protein [Minisyncoccota bacterium]